jgi:hypothetical protein
VDGQPHRDGSTLRRAPEIPGLAGPTCARHPPDLRPPVQDTGAMPVGPLPRFPGTAWRGPVGRTRECRAPRRRTAPARSMLSRRNPSKVDPRSASRSPSWTRRARPRRTAQPARTQSLVLTLRRHTNLRRKRPTKATDDRCRPTRPIPVVPGGAAGNTDRHGFELETSP